MRGLVGAVAALALVCASVMGSVAYADEPEDNGDDEIAVPEVTGDDQADDEDEKVAPDRTLIPEQEDDEVGPQPYDGAPVGEDREPDVEREDGPVTGFDFDANASDLLDGMQTDDE
jgi:hypothetical protein